MFPEYREQIAQLRANDRHFARIFEEHNDLDHAIKQLETKRSSSLYAEIETMKKQKLMLKEELYSMLRKHEKTA